MMVYELQVGENRCFVGDHLKVVDCKLVKMVSMYSQFQAVGCITSISAARAIASR
jgi:hypothetical protein